jgi:hypothetical protein
MKYYLMFISLFKDSIVGNGITATVFEDSVNNNLTNLTCGRHDCPGPSSELPRPGDKTVN